MMQLRILTVIFVLYAIAFLIVPKYMGLLQIPIGDGHMLIQPWSDTQHGDPTTCDGYSFMNETCHMWKTYPNITRIRFYLLATGGCDDHNPSVIYIYHFLAVSISIFIILALLFAYNAYPEHIMSKVLVCLFVIMWIPSIVFDIFGVSNYESLNSFVYQRTFDVQGKIFSDTTMRNQFYDQGSFVQQVCDMRTYFYDNDQRWFVEFDTCDGGHIFDTNKTTSIMLKVMSLALAVTATIFYGYVSREKN